MIILVDRNGKLAAIAGAMFNISATSDDFFYCAAHVPLKEWAAWRDGTIKRDLDLLPWLDFWDAPDGEYVVRAGMYAVTKRGDVASLRLALISEAASASYQWRRGTPCPAAWTPASIAAYWDERVNETRYRIVAAGLREDCIARWDAEAQADARACLAAAAEARWQDALDIARRRPRLLPVAYLARLVEGAKQ